MADRKRCRWCDTPIPPKPGPGRPREFCTNSCRQRSYLFGALWNGVTLSQLHERDGGDCYLCHEPIDLEVTGGPMAPCFDHILPVSRGGQTAKDNLACVHVICNTRKGARLLAEEEWPAFWKVA